MDCYWVRGSRRISEEAIRWVDLIRRGRAEDAEFLSWARRSPARIEAFLDVWATWDELQRLSADQRTRIEALANSRTMRAGKVLFRSRLWQRRPQLKLPSRHGTDRKLLRRMALGVVMSAAMFFAVVVSTSHLRPLFDTTVIYQTRNGEYRLVVLADGSKVRMNADTELRVQVNERSRDVEIGRGEAMFDVARDASRPFRVRAGRAVALALGTKFAVALNRDLTSVVVVNGCVAVFSGHTGNAPTQPVEIGAGQEVSVVSSEHGESLLVRVLETETSARRLKWAVRELSFRSTPLAEAVAEINRHNVDQITIDDALLAERRISGRMRIDQPEIFVNAVQRMFEGPTVKGAPRIHVNDPGHSCRNSMR
jgi:transmembrane sensor